MVTDASKPGDPNGDKRHVRYTVLSQKAISWWAILIVAVGVGMAMWMLLAYGRRDPQMELEAIRTAGTIVVGTGGAAALLLAARRQRAAEIALKQKDSDLQHQQQVALDAREDAEQRRITELYARAAEQLGSDKAPVRLASLYALERLAQEVSTQRQTIVNVLCAYLRMPYTPPGEAPAKSNEDAVTDIYREQLQEQMVRLTAQRILTYNLRTDHVDHTYLSKEAWEAIDLDLTNATLIDFDLSGCTARMALFTSASFVGPADFVAATFNGPVSFRSATFAASTHFDQATFLERVDFEMVDLAEPATFDSASFAGQAPIIAAQAPLSTLESPIQPGCQLRSNLDPAVPGEP